MSKILLIPKYEEKNGGCNGQPLQKIYMMEGTEIVGQVSPYAVAPLRILAYILKTKGIDYQVMLNDTDPWAITQMQIAENDADFVKVALEEIMKYRCAFELGNGYENIIRQLPFAIAMQTSEAMIPFPVSPHERKNYDAIVNDEENIFHVDPPREISKDQLVLKKHMIYTSARGGYNIKTKGYDDRSLNHYCYTDSRTWD